MTVTRFPLIFAINLYVGAFKAMVNQANSIPLNISNTATVRLTETRTNYPERSEAIEEGQTCPETAVNGLSRAYRCIIQEQN